MSYQKIRSLLETRLNQLSAGFQTAFENVPFNPVNGTPYQRIQLLPARTENPTMGDGFKRELGILQVVLSFPVNAGPSALANRAGAIVDGFARGSTFVDGTLRVIIDESPYIGQGIPDGAWYRAAVSVPFVADVYEAS